MKTFLTLSLMLACTVAYADEKSASKAAVAIAISKAKNSVKPKAVTKSAVLTSLDDAKKEADDKSALLIVWIGQINKEAVEQIKEVHVQVSELPAYPKAKCAVFTVEDNKVYFKGSVESTPSVQVLKTIVEGITKETKKKKVNEEFFISFNAAEEYVSDPVCTVDEFGRTVCSKPAQFVQNTTVNSSPVATRTVSRVPIFSRIQQWRMNRPFRLFFFCR